MDRKSQDSFTIIESGKLLKEKELCSVRENGSV